METSETTKAGFSLSAPHAVLWLSAFLLAAIVLLQMGNRFGSTAQAEMVGQRNNMTVMTTDGGTQELCFVIDGTPETLFVYEVDGGRRVDLLDRQSLPEMFRAARASAMGGG